MKKTYKKNIIIFFIIAIIVASPILTNKVNNLDELWIYNFSRNISEGKLPYKDFSVMQMPLLFIICGTVLKIIANELIVMRILAIILNASIFFMTYKILEQLKINKYCIILYTIICYKMFSACVCIDYNFSILLIALIAMYLEFKELEKNKKIIIYNKKKDFCLGILVGTSILFKQTTGLFLTVIFILYKLLLAKGKEEFKITGKIILTRTLGVCIPVICLCIYLTLNNIWAECIDYTILGIKNFSNSVSYINLIKNNNIDIKILSILVPITIVYMYVESVFKEAKNIEQKNIFIFFVYSVACFIVIYPISDRIHFLIGSMPTLLAIAYIACIKLKIKNDIKKVFFTTFIKAISIMLLVLTVVSSIIKTTQYLVNTNFSTLKHYKYIGITETLENEIKTVDDYIIKQEKEEKKTYILDATACIFMMPIDRYNKNYDNFTKGCFGRKDENDIINDLENEKNIIVLITKDEYSKNWQTPLEVLKYIKENWNYIESIECFDVYEKK